MAERGENSPGSIRNLNQICGHGSGSLRKQALSIVEAGLTACDGGAATRDCVTLLPGGVRIDGTDYPLTAGQRLYVLGAGKATLPVARALVQILGNRIDEGCIVLKRGPETTLDRVQVLIADHPLPTADSVLAARRIAGLAERASEGDLVITSFTGGRSALLSLPPEQVTLDEKRQLNELLIGSGMPISAINTVRKHVSGIKGGRLAELISPARIVNLTISDVAGDHLDVLADLTTQDSSSPADAIAILRQFELLEELPDSIARFLESPDSASPDLGGIEIETVMLVNGASVCLAMAEAARQQGLEPLIVGTDVEGPARETGERIAGLAREARPGTVLIGCGGESTVRLGGSGPGLGGPNQEAAIAASGVLDGSRVAAVFLDTDGSDGSTGWAGAICDGETLGRAASLSLDLAASMRSHTVSEPLRALGDLIDTGPTGTNVNDLFVAVVGPE